MSCWIGRRGIRVREYDSGLNQRTVEAEVSTVAGDERAERVGQLADERDLYWRTCNLYWTMNAVGRLRLIGKVALSKNVVA